MCGALGLWQYDVSPTRGFLPKQDPCVRLSPHFQCWEEYAREMPALLAAGKFGTHVNTMPVVSARQLPDTELALAHTRLAFMLHGYMRECQQKNMERILVPSCLGLPLVEISNRIGLPPVLSYSPYGLHNWRRLDQNGPIALGNLAVLQNFLGGLDETWFILVHVEIEAHAGEAIWAVIRAQEAAKRGDLVKVACWLRVMAEAQQRMYETLCRMPEGCDPYIYYRRVRPYLFVPENVVFDGMPITVDAPRPFRGETGAQSTIAPLFDAVLGVTHEPSELSDHLIEMRWYMPPKHRALLEEVERRKPISLTVRSFHDARAAYNSCLELLAKFREKHYEYGVSYINRQACTVDGSNPTDIGTGHTRFMKSLKKHVDETRAAILC